MQHSTGVTRSMQHWSDQLIAFHVVELCTLTSRDVTFKKIEATTFLAYLISKLMLSSCIFKMSSVIFEALEMTFVCCLQGNAYICRGWLRSPWLQTMTSSCSKLGSVLPTWLHAPPRAVLTWRERRSKKVIGVRIMIGCVCLTDMSQCCIVSHQNVNSLVLTSWIDCWLGKAW